MTNNSINYIEFKSTNLAETKAFYSSVFNWEFTDYGSNYIAFKNSGVEGGFEKTAEPICNGALIVIEHKALEEVISKIENAGCKITTPLFSFPGGKRFHFHDPSGNELAVWCQE